MLIFHTPPFPTGYIPQQLVVPPSVVCLRSKLQACALQVLVFLQPGLYVFRITLDPCCLGADGVDALGKRLVVTLGVLICKECLDVFDVLLPRKAGRGDGDDGAKHAQTGRKSLLELLPVLLDPTPKSLDTFWVRTQRR